MESGWLVDAEDTTVTLFSALTVEQELAREELEITRECTQNSRTGRGAGKDAHASKETDGGLAGIPRQVETAGCGELGC